MPVKSNAYHYAYNKNTYYIVRAYLPKEKETAIRERAESLGLSVNGYLNELIRKDLEGNETK